MTKFAEMFAIECLSLVSLPNELFFYNQLTFIKLERGGMNALRICNHHLVAVGNCNHNFQLISKEALKPSRRIYLAERGVIKGRGAEILSKIRPILLNCQLKYAATRDRTGDL